MVDHRAEDCGAVVGCDGADYDAICSWRLVVTVRTGFEDRELEVRLLGVLEWELLVVWEVVRLYEIGFGPDGSKYVVDVRILVTTQSLSLRCEAQCLCASSIDGGTIVLSLVVAVAAFWLAVLKVVQGLLLSEFLP